MLIAQRQHFTGDHGMEINNEIGHTYRVVCCISVDWEGNKSSVNMYRLYKVVMRYNANDETNTNKYYMILTRTLIYIFVYEIEMSLRYSELT